MSYKRNVRRKAIQRWKKDMKSPFYLGEEQYTFVMKNNEYKLTKVQ